jgi:hypothetical protein
VLRNLLRGYSYVFHLLLAIFLLGVSALALASGGGVLRLPMLPWEGVTLTYVVLGCSLFGLISVLLAIFGKWRFLFLLWSLAVFVMLVKGYVFSGYKFAPGGVGTAIWLTAAALVAAIGAAMWKQNEHRSRLR